MKIAIYVTRGFYPQGSQVAISGHVQSSLKTAEILVKRGHQVTLITTQAPGNWRIPLDAAVTSELEVKTVKQGTRAWPNHSIDLLGSFQSIYELRALLRSTDFDLVHFFGLNKTAYLLGLLRMTGIRQPGLMTMVSYGRPKSSFCERIENLVFSNIDCFITLTEYTKRKLLERGVGPVHVTRPGILGSESHDRDCSLRIRSGATDLVLFWRDAEYSNGVDICIDAFKKLSREFESTDFVFAVRPDHEFEEQLRQVDRQYENIHLLIFPYGDGITIEKLIDSASCVILPFRSLSCNPQLATLETILRGTFLVTTPVESNAELVEDSQVVRYVKPSDVEDTCLAIKHALEHKQQVRKLAIEAQSQAVKKWNWRMYEQRLMDVYRLYVPAA